jgi:signal transduction histidine kinase
LGDIRGGISVSFPAKPLLDAMNQQVASSAAAHFAAWLVVLVILFSFDVYRQRKESQLAESDHLLAEEDKMVALGSMVAGVAHEVNTPLGVCVTAASMVQDSQRRIAMQLADGTLTQENLQAELDSLGQASTILEQNLQRAAKLIRSFKQVAVDQNTSEAREVDIKHFLDDILTAHYNMLKKADVKTQINCPDNLVITTDAGAFAQIVTNLLQNTLFHAVAPGQETQVCITVHDLGKQIELVYSDNGKGMDAATAKRAFEPFFTTKRGEGGSGLGLNIVYNLATQRFRGNVTLDSRPGQGATFTLHLTKD